MAVQKLEKANIEDMLALTPTQEGMLYHYLSEPWSDHYVEQLSLRMNGKVDIAHMLAAWNAVCRDNEMLRTVFRWEGLDKPLQVILKEKKVDVAVHDLSRYKSEAQEVQLDEIKSLDKQRKFDLQAEAFRVTLCIRSERSCDVIISNHHIIYDGWSTGIILKEFLDAYDRLTGGREPVAPPHKSKYKDYILWLAKQDRSKEMQYWTEIVSSFERGGVLPGDRFHQGTDSEQWMAYSADLPSSMKQSLEAFASANEVTSAAVLYTVWGLVLQRFTSRNDIWFGTTVSGRVSEIAGIDQSVGMYINTLPLRMSCSQDLTAAALVRQVHEALIGRKEFEHTSLPEIQAMSRSVEGDLFQSIVVLENYPIGRVFEQEGRALSIEGYSMFERTHYDLTVQISSFDSMELQVIYNSSKFSSAAIERIAQCYSHLLSDLLQHPNQLCSTMEWMPAEEREIVLSQSNGREEAFPSYSSICRVFEEKAAVHPEKTALCYGDYRFTYGELNWRSNQLAKWLRRQGAGSGSIVGLMTQRSPEMIVGLLGIMKAGAAYMPILPELPADRVRYMLEDSGAKLLLTHEGVLGALRQQSTLLESLKQSQIPVYSLDAGLVFDSDDSNLLIETNENSLAYVIYTSGSTGNPKGVMVEHRSALNTLHAMQLDYPIEMNDTYLLKTAFSFDVSVCELFGWFFGGGRLAILEPGGEKDAFRIASAIHKYKVTHVNFVPSVLSVLLQELDEEHLGHLSSLKYVMVAGEAMKPKLAEMFFDKLPSVPLFNLYGPTEASVYASHYAVAASGRHGSVPIGKPLANMRIYILNDHNQLCPVGVQGELCISGVGVARGYLNRDQLTQEVFVDDPIVPGNKMYRTGDLACLLPDGNIDYAGRKDHQIKIKGFRVELGEIESVLVSHPLVTESAVVKREDRNGDAYLCGFYTADAQVPTNEVRSRLRLRLPEHMVPAYLEQLAAMPLTANGKLDRKALPEGGPSPERQQTEYEAPRTQIEQTLAQVWEEALGHKPIGIHDSFFGLGGDSIKAMKITARLHKYGYRLEIKHLLLHGTIRDLGPYVQLKKQNINQDNVQGLVKLMPIQHFFLEHIRTDRHYFNQSYMLYASNGFAEEALRAAFHKLTRHHDALRIVYRTEGQREELRQWNRPASDAGLDFQTVSLYSIEPSHIEQNIVMLANECQASMNLEQGPLLKARLFRTTHGDHLLIAIHHLIVDGVSWRILLEDLAALYEQALKHLPLELGEKTTSFQEWSDRLYEYSNSAALLREAEYWQQLGAEAAPGLPFIRQEGGSGNRTTDKTATIELDAKYTSALQHRVHAAYYTNIEDYLLTALGSAFKRMTEQDHLLLYLEGHGRQEIIEETRLERSVGWFTSIYPVQLDMSAIDFDAYDATIPRQLKQVKEQLRQIPNKGVGYGILKYLTPEEHGIAAALRQHRSPQVSFNYLGQFDDDFSGLPFTISSIGTGQEISARQERATPVEIYGQISGGKLQFTIVYNGEAADEGAMEQLADHYAAELRRLIDHGMAVKEPVCTPSHFPLAEVTMDELDRLTDELASEGQQLEDLYTLSPMQEGMLFHSLLDSGSEAYIQQIGLRLTDAPDIEVMERSLEQLAEQHERLRTRIIHEGAARPHQAVIGRMGIPFHYDNLAHCSPKEQQERIEQAMDTERAEGFDLSGSSALLRVSVLELGAGECHMIWTYHHILMDGWCAGILFERYFKLLRGASISEEPVTPYVRYIEWLKKQDTEQAASYWSRYLEQYEQPASLPKKHLSSVTGGYDPGQLSWHLPAAIVDGLSALAKRSGTTLYTVFQAAWGILLQRYSGTKDVVFGSVVSGRSPDVQGIDHMVGLFINTVPVRVQAEDGDGFEHLLSKLHRNNVEHQSYDYLSLAEIQSLTGLKANLLNHILIYENYPLDKDAIRGGEDGKLRIEDIQVHERTSYELDVTIVPEDGLHVHFHFNRLTYDERLIRQIIRHAEHVMEQIVRNPAVLLSDIAVLTPEDERQLIDMFNAKAAPIPQDTVHQRFEHVAREYPERTAVIWRDERISYKQLNERANRLAHYLIEAGVGKEELVAVLMDRSPAMLASIMAIWKAGGAYIPVDPEYPASRQLAILNESGVRFAVTDSGALKQELSQEGETPVQFIRLDRIAGSMEGYGSDNPAVPVETSQLAYVIFTSGSTGTPKGTMIEHAGMFNHIEAEIQELSLGSGTVLAQNASHCFDISVWQFCAALTVGGATAIYENEVVKDPALFIERIIRDGVTILEVVPAYLGVMMDYMDENGIKPEALDYLMITGETVKPATVKRWFGLCPSIRMVNAYGPAEAADDISQYVMDGVPETEAIPIGSPLQNLNLYIVDEALRLCPIGVIGEICVSGIGVGRGYWNKPELTAASFMNDPFRPERDERMYRTGDLGRWLPDGNIEFIGRKDYQVKIRGFRIELGEIEAKLMEHPWVKSAVVLDLDDGQGGRALCAYAEGDTDSTDKPSSEDVRSFIGDRLPDYMIPATVMFLPELPLTPNGKADRKALPRPESIMNNDSLAIELPHTATEQRLAALWREVLGVDRIGRGHSFFELGGHSLKAMALVSRIRAKLATVFQLSDVFRYPTLALQASQIDQRERSAGQLIPQAPVQPYYPASAVQKRLFALSQLEGAGTNYNITMTYRLEGPVNRSRLEQAWQQVVQHSAALRTSFIYADGQLMQRIACDVPAHIEQLHSLPDSAEWDTDADQIQSALQRFFRPFELTAGPLFRAGLLELTPERHILALDIHHTIADGISLQIIAEDLLACYGNEPLPPVQLQYKDYSSWLERPEYADVHRKNEAFWLSELSGELPMLNLMSDYARPPEKSFEGDHVYFRVDETTAKQLRSLSEGSGTTLYAVLLAAFNVLLARYSDQEELIVGTPVAGRIHEGLERTVGMFVNTVALRNTPLKEWTFTQFLASVKTNALSAFEHQEYPFDQLVDKLGIQRDASRNPLFDTMFIMQNMERGPLQYGEITAAPYDYLHPNAKFDLTMVVAEESGGGLQGGIEYCTKLFRLDTVQRLAAQYGFLLEQIVRSGGDIRLQDLSLVNVQEQQLLVHTFNETASPYPNATLHQLFEQQAERYPDQTAVIYRNERCSYRQLNERANAMARSIVDRMASLPDSENGFVGIMAERSVEMIISVLAVLKAGCAYVPVDPAYPEERIQYMLQHSKIAIVLAHLKYAPVLPAKIHVIDIDNPLLSERDSSNLSLDIAPDSLANMIYTSGSTGQPKGVMIEHRSLVNYTSWRIGAYGLTPGDCTLQNISFSFDGFGSNLYSALLSGGSLLLIDEHHSKDFLHIKNLIAEHRVASTSFVPSMYRALLDYARQGELDSLKFVVLAAEKPAPDLIQKSASLLPRTLLINEYGPTENTIATTAHIGITATTTSIIGKPIGNHQVYVVDAAMQLVPVGVPGQVCVSGDGLARGYFEQPAWTEERFIVNPHTGKRMYLTGDMARWMKDGTIEFLGRVDNQVKIRGFRIELEEIVSRLLVHPEIKDAAVIDRTDSNGQPYLCAYVIRKAGSSPVDYRTFLTAALPDYMIPSYFVQLPKLPLTPNGKLDRRALPEPDLSSASEEAYEAPRTEMEAKLVQVWQDVLGAGRIGIRDHFFKCGGDSIKAIQVASRLHQIGLSLEMKVLFQYPTIIELAPFVKETAERLDQGEVSGETALTPIQGWFFRLPFEERHHFNQSVMLYRSAGFDAGQVQAVFDELMRHHDGLRTVYKQRDGRWTAYIRSVADAILPVVRVVDVTGIPVSVRESTIREHVERTQSSMDLEHGPLVKLTLFQTDEGDHLHIVIHHLVVDGVSWRILLEDFAMVYEQTMHRQSIAIADKTVSFRQWAAYMQQYAEHPSLLAEIAYWKTIEQKGRTKFPADAAAEPLDPAHNAAETFNCSEEETEQLLKGVHKAYNTEMNDILLAALGLALGRWSGEKVISIHLEGHGREALDQAHNIARTVGWFTSQYPVVLDMGRSDDLGYQLKSIKEELRQVPNHGIGYGILEHLTSSEAVKGTLSFDVEPDICFNYLGQTDQQLATDVFQLSSLDSGTNISPRMKKLYSLEWNGMVVQGRLQFSVAYNRAMYRDESIQTMARYYQEALAQIIAHCMGKENTEVSPSDLVYSGISIDKLSQIKQMLNKKIK